jgi:D-hexose-6-phosphate mutarotase
VHLHGGCVTSYKAPHEVLALRKDAVFDGSKPIAGGLQLCWPQFGPGKIQQVKPEDRVFPSLVFEKQSFHAMVWTYSWGRARSSRCEARGS